MITNHRHYMAAWMEMQDDREAELFDDLRRLATWKPAQRVTSGPHGRDVLAMLGFPASEQALFQLDHTNLDLAL